MLSQLVYIHTYIHITASLLDPHDIHHEGKKVSFKKNIIHLLLELTLRYWLSLNHRMRNGSDGSW